MTKFARTRGSTLVELMVALVVLGIILPVIVRAFIQMPNSAARMQVQNRVEAWRTFTDRVSSKGVDPFATGVTDPITSATEAATLGDTIVRSTEEERPGAARVTYLGRSFTDMPLAEVRGLGLGGELGAGSSVPPRVDPLPPLDPIVLAPPTLSPAPGTSIPVATLLPGANPGDPYTTTIRATAASAVDRVLLEVSAPFLSTVTSVAAANQSVDAVSLAQLTSGRSWSEFAGSASDIAIALGDGRHRWVVDVGDRLQAYEPSTIVNFDYGVSIGRPIYQVAASAFTSGSDIGINYESALAIEAGDAQALIGYPLSVTSRFGGSWGSLAPRFDWSVDWFSGDSILGNTYSLFTAANRPNWGSTQTLSATPLFSASGVSASVATWSLSLVTMTLGVPEYSTGIYEAGTDSANSFEFTAPFLGSTAVRVGRPRVDALESAGSSLTVPIIP